MRTSPNLLLNKTQKEILIGLILGDGNLEFNGCQGTRIQIKQAKNKKSYVFWLYKEFKNLTNIPPKQRRDNGAWYFATRYFKHLTEYYRLFYPQGKKSIPSEIEKMLISPLSLAIWFMDDGSLDFRIKSHYAFILHTEGFHKKEVKLLRKVLLKNFGISSSIHKSTYRGRIKYKLYIGKSGREKFYCIIRPYILPVFYYKLPIIPNPSETSRN